MAGNTSNPPNPGRTQRLNHMLEKGEAIEALDEMSDEHCDALVAR